MANTLTRRQFCNTNQSLSHLETMSVGSLYFNKKIQFRGMYTDKNNQFEIQNQSGNEKILTLRFM